MTQALSIQKKTIENDKLKRYVTCQPCTSMSFPSLPSDPTTKWLGRIVLLLYCIWLGWFLSSYISINLHIPSGKLTWQWKMDDLKMYFLLKMGILHCHVSLAECIYINIYMNIHMHIYMSIYPKAIVSSPSSSPKTPSFIRVLKDNHLAKHWYVQCGRTRITTI